MLGVPKHINARSGLAGTGKHEVLMFSLGKDNRTGREETFGIDVLKVREVTHAPALNRTPEMPASVAGMANLHGAPVLVIDLAKHIGIVSNRRPETLIVTEYNGQPQGFLVWTVGSMLPLDWSAMRDPPEILQAEMAGLVTAISELDDGRMVLLLDMERVLADMARADFDGMENNSVLPPGEDRPEFDVYGSLVTRSQAMRTLDGMKAEIHPEEGRLAGMQNRKPDQFNAREDSPISEKIEILRFSLGGNERFGVSVSKIKEVCPAGKITRTPNMPAGVEGIVWMHGHVMPVLNLAMIMGILSPERHRNMMVSEFNNRFLGFLVQRVDRIIRVDKDKIRATEGMFSDNGKLIAATAEMNDGSLISIVDIEQVIANAFGDAVFASYGKVEPVPSVHLLRQ